MQMDGHMVVKGLMYTVISHAVDFAQAYAIQEYGLTSALSLALTKFFLYIIIMPISTAVSHQHVLLQS